jgi:prolyl oligopeptidase
VRIDPDHSQEEHWVTLVEGTDEAVLQWANIVGNRLLVHFTRDILSEWKVYDLDGSYLYTVELPDRGIINGFGGSQDQSVTWYTFNNLITPETIYRYDIYSNTSSLYKASESSFKSGNYVLKQEFYSSRDGTKVPIFIVHKKNLYLDNRRPTLLYGYGGFNIAMKPYFSKALTVILENDGVYALANIRGGNEYGEKWHQGGMLFNKQNVFDDFTAAAEYLFIQGYTDPDYLAIRGRSNGGLLIGAVLNQKPQICRVAFPEVGVMDMLRYEKFTIGYAWAVEYGSVKNEANFTNLLSYSPLHNINTDIHYPSILIYTADHDDRVVPAHSFKYAAAMQRAQAGQDPILIRIGRNAGHGRGRPTRKIIDEYAEKWGFMFYEMGVPIRP